MRFLTINSRDELKLTKDLVDEIPPYAILSHRWGADEDEVTFNDLEKGLGKTKAGYAKLLFCGKQARKDNLKYFWVDTCCINKANHAELSEAITSMFRWYRDADRCYVHLLDVSTSSKGGEQRIRTRNSTFPRFRLLRRRKAPASGEDEEQADQTWESAFRNSEWFTRGWTLQELLAPVVVEFFSREGILLGNKTTLERLIHEITQIPITALRNGLLSQFSDRERLQWAANRKTRKKEDKAYCLLGIFDIFMPLMYGEGDNAFGRLQEEIAKRLASPNQAHWIVARPTNPLFTGRGDHLRGLDSKIRRAVGSLLRQEQCRIVVTGLGGQGKSEICLQLASRLRPIFWAVFWIDVSTTALAERAFLHIAEKLSIPAQTWEDARLSIANLQQPWLLVLDNADDPNVDYQRYFPSGVQGVVMLTSRNEACHQYATENYVALDGLADDEARELLLRAAQIHRDQHAMIEDDAQAVASLLQSHPLALIQAGAYVARGHCTLAQYPQVFTQYRKRLLAFRPVQAQSRYQDVYATFEASAAILQSSQTEAAKDALLLLPILAWCGPNRLPLVLFEAGWRMAKEYFYPDTTSEDDEEVGSLTQWHVSRLPPFMHLDTDTWDSFRLIEAVQLLKALSLVSTDDYDSDTSVSMHPLTHAWARDRQDSAQQQDSWVMTSCIVALSRSDTELWRRRGRQLQPHLQALISLEMIRIMFTFATPKKITSLIVKCGWLMDTLRDDTKLFELINELFYQLGLDSRRVDKDWLGVYNIAARNLFHSFKYQEAVSLLEQVVKIQEQTLAEDDQDRLQSEHELAIAYEENGQVKEAILLLEQVLKIKEQTQAEDHPSRLASQHALAIAYKENGQVEEAVLLLEQVVKIREQILAKDHPDRLASQHALAGAYNENGQVKEAILLLEQVVKIEEQTLVEDHPSRLASQHALARAYHENGQAKEAISLLEQVVKIEEQTLPEDHPNRLASQHVLAIAYLDNGQVKEAVLLLEQVVKIQEQTLAEDHPDRLTSQHGLARIYWDLGRRDTALKMMKQVVEIQSQVLNESHPDRILSEDWLKKFEHEMREHELELEPS